MALSRAPHDAWAHQLKGEAKEVSPEFEALFQEAMKQPQVQHTSR